ncbi:MAG: 4'-phosphopantetheinyl transferase superfamily protein [Bacteroidales bacterium]|jgi:4'-phosphopantetheinyl transferase|nr:4'-phosphopantetheinyl transferase superfamily protein [Bacteroidales bacterium]MCI1732768.1 4'-phosphopantetheinyl transferase superfamily protein [Bacteroidales bacterium]
MGLYTKKELKDGTTIAVWEIKETEDELLKIIGTPKEDLEDLFLIKSAQLRREKLAVRALINSVFEEEMHLGHHDNGSPYLVNNMTHISVTHTNNFAAIIINPSEDVGIDIECLDRDFSAVEKKALSENEIDDLLDEKEDDDERKRERTQQLAIYWCAKEALYKRMGRHDVDFSKDMEIEKFSIRDEGDIDAVFKYPKDEHIVNEDGEEENEEEEFELEYEVFANHVMVWLVG